jgi:hypothetical protein
VISRPVGFRDNQALAESVLSVPLGYTDYSGPRDLTYAVPPINKTDRILGNAFRDMGGFL